MVIPTAAKLAINVVVPRLMGFIEHSFRNVRNVVESGQSAFNVDGMLAAGGSYLRAMTACDPISDSAWFSPSLAYTVCPSPELS